LLGGTVFGSGGDETTPAIKQLSLLIAQGGPSILQARPIYHNRAGTLDFPWKPCDPNFSPLHLLISLRQPLLR
jgi:hypothetical protein